MNQKIDFKLPKFIGHRGVKNLCPENTIESVSKAFDLGLSFVEIDVKISKDQIPILLHDDTLDRTTTGTGLVSDFTYSNLKKLDAGKFFYNKKTNIYIPRLIDVLDLCVKRDGNLNIELKPNNTYEKINVEKVSEITKNIKGINMFFSSFDLISIEEITKIFPQSNRSLLIDSFDKHSFDEFLRFLQVNNIKICGLNLNIISNELIKKLKKNNILITVYSDNDISISKARYCFELGIDSIFIDDPTNLIY